MFKIPYKIAVRSYDRPEMFRDHTYSMLSKQDNIDLSEQLYIFVADPFEEKRYKKSLEGLPYKEMVVGEKGAANINRFMGNYFEKGENVFFLDDDHTKFIEWQCNPTTNKDLFFKDSCNLHLYILWGFDQIENHNLGAFTFGGISNSLFIKDKPWASFFPVNLYGAAFGLKNDPNIVGTKYSQNDDVERGIKLFDLYGGIIKFNWVGFPADNYGVFDGGMQSSGDRGFDEEKSLLVKQQAEKLFDEFPSAKKYFTLKYNEYRDWIDFKILTKSHFKKNGFQIIDWMEYFGERNKPENNLEGFFNG